MNQTLKPSLQEVENYVAKVSDSVLYGENFVNHVYDRYEVKAPSLQPETTEVKIEQEIITMQNAPRGMSYSPGRPMDYAFFSVKVADPAGVLDMLFRNKSIDNHRVYKNGRIFYKEHSKEQISGNEEVLQRLKKNAKDFFESATKLFNDFGVEAAEFNETVLKPHIIKVVEQERIRRKTDKDSLRKLNPFN